MTCLLIFLCNVCAQAEQTVRVAVSANFTNTMHALTRLFNEQHQCRIQTSAASTAMLSLQIEQGANFDLFFFCR